MSENTAMPAWVTEGLDAVREEKELIPTTQNVLLQIEKCDYRSMKDGEERNWKWLDIGYKIVDGIEVNGEIKYRGKLLFGNMVCTFANYDFYLNKGSKYAESIKKGQHMVDLKYLVKATGIDGVKLESINGISDITASEIAEKILGAKVKGNIIQKKDGDLMKNAVVNLKAVSNEDLV